MTTLYQIRPRGISGAPVGSSVASSNISELRSTVAMLDPSG